MWWSGRGVGLALVLASATWATAAEDGPRLTARAAIVVDAGTGASIWERDADLPLPPASTTKVLTAILALESQRLDDSLRVSANAAATAPSKLGLRPGQRVVVRDLLFALLLKSANDASTVVAEGIGGSEGGFADRMNARARSLGATRSHFENAHGLTAPGHVSTARDLTRIFRHGLRMPLFRDVLETPSAQVPIESARPQMVTVRSHNRLLTNYAYPVIGKTGYTRPAKRCFVGAARSGDREVVIALLGSTDLWGDAKRLIEFALGTPPDQPVVQTARAPAPAELRAAPAERSRPRSKRSGPVARTMEGDAAADETPRQAAKSAGKGRFTVQLGPYRNKKGVMDARDKLKRRGYTAQVVGQTLRLGTFSNKGRADRVADRLRVSGYRPTIVALR